MYNNHKVDIQLQNKTASLYWSGAMEKTFEVYLSPDIRAQRQSILQCLYQITKNTNYDEFESTVGFRVDSEGYNETFCLKHKTDISDEILVNISNRKINYVGNIMVTCSENEFIRDLELYLLATKEMHTESIHHVYADVISKLLKHYGYKTIIKRSMLRRFHHFDISPNLSSNLSLNVQIIFTPKRRGLAPSIRDIIQKSIVKFL